MHQFSLAYVAALLLNYWRSIVKRIMNRTPRNFGQSFSTASFVVGVVEVTEADIILVIVVGVGLIMAEGRLVKFARGHSIMHISTVAFNAIAPSMAF